jgi:hypothetical protein
MLRSPYRYWSRSAESDGYVISLLTVWHKLPDRPLIQAKSALFH